MIDSLHSRWVERVGNEFVLDVTSPIQTSMRGAYNGARNVLMIVPDFFHARAENVFLRNQVGQLEQQVIALKEELRQERRVRSVVEYSEKFESRKIIARVIGTNPTGWFSTVLVDKGRVHGVRNNLPVLSSSGLVGHVIETSYFSSKVLLLNDPDSKVSVIVEKERTQGVVQGDSENGCLLKYIESTADIKDGDLVITSGYSHIYPKGLIVGEITDIRNMPGNLFQWARVVPRTDFRRLEEVAILLVPEIHEVPAHGGQTDELLPAAAEES